MSPRMEADFDWGEVQATTPIYPKGVYELSIKSIRASAWAKTDQAGNPTGEITRVIRIRPVMVGVYDSAGKLKSEQDGKEIKGGDVEEINMWVHSDGARKMSKRTMMAVCGYNPDEPEDEKAFNDFLAQSKLDLSMKLEENGEGGYVLSIGDGYEKLLVGKSVRAAMEPETREVEGRDPIIQQNFTRLTPVNA